MTMTGSPQPLMVKQLQGKLSTDSLPKGSMVKRRSVCMWMLTAVVDATVVVNT